MLKTTSVKDLAQRFNANNVHNASQRPVQNDTSADQDLALGLATNHAFVGFMHHRDRTTNERAAAAATGFGTEMDAAEVARIAAELDAAEAARIAAELEAADKAAQLASDEQLAQQLQRQFNQ